MHLCVYELHLHRNLHHHKSKTWKQKCRNIDARLRKLLFPFLTVRLCLYCISDLLLIWSIKRVSSQKCIQMNCVNFFGPNFPPQTKNTISSGWNLQTIHIWSLPFFHNHVLRSRLIFISFYFWLSVAGYACVFVWLHIETNKRLQNNDPDWVKCVCREYLNVCLVHHAHVGINTQSHKTKMFEKRPKI